MGFGAYHITIRLLLDEHAGDKERQHLQLARDLVTEVRALITDGQSPEGWPAIVTEIEVSPDIEPESHNADYVAPESRKLIGPPHAHYDAPCTDACYESADPGDDEDDGSEYFRALDRHDNAQKAEETETAEKQGRDGKQAS